MSGASGSAFSVEPGAGPSSSPYPSTTSPMVLLALSVTIVLTLLVGAAFGLLPALRSLNSRDRIRSFYVSYLGFLLCGVASTAMLGIAHRGDAAAIWSLVVAGLVTAFAAARLVQLHVVLTNGDATVELPLAAAFRGILGG